VTPGPLAQTSRERRGAGLERVDSILHDRFPEFHISSRRLRQAESIQLIRDRRAAANQQLGLHSDRLSCASYRSGALLVPVSFTNGATVISHSKSPATPISACLLARIASFRSFLATLAVRQQTV
jgi:hypothetical protein